MEDVHGPMIMRMMTRPSFDYRDGDPMHRSHALFSVRGTQNLNT